MASLISKFNLIQRIKVIKDLILQVLDRISSQLGIITSRLEGIETTTNSSLENEGSLLQASIYLVETLQQQTQIRQEQQNQIIQQLGILQQQSQIHDQILQQTQALQQQQNQIQQQQNQIQQQQNQIQQQIEALQQQTGVILTTEQYSLLNPEVGLMTYLYSYLPSRTALDIGANAGEVSERLLQSGYEVYAFEPFSPVFDKLTDRLSKYVGFHPYNFAVGATDGTMDLHIAEDISETDKYKDFSLFNSLSRHSMPEDLQFGSTVPVLVRSLETLHRSLEIPDNVGLVKIDTEGFDIEVIKGMGEYRYSVVVTEFWDSNIPFGKSGAMNKLEEQVKEMKQRDYHWYLVVYRIWGCSNGAAFYCNHSQAVDNSWGNIFFFQNYDVFDQALKWCSAVLPTTYFNS